MILLLLLTITPFIVQGITVVAGLVIAVLTFRKFKKDAKQEGKHVSPWLWFWIIALILVVGFFYFRIPYSI